MKSIKSTNEDSKESTEAVEYFSESDGDSVLEKPKGKTIKEKKPYVMTEARKQNMEKMRLARTLNLEKRRELRQVDEDKKNAEKSLADKMLEKKTKKTQKQTKAIKIIQAELSDTDSEEEEEVEVVVKPKKKVAKKKTVKKVLVSDSESEDDRHTPVNYIFV